MTCALGVYDALVRFTGAVFVVVAVNAWAQAPDDLPPELEEEADPAFARVANPAFPSPAVASVPIDRGPKLERAELAPYFAEGKLAEAKAAYDAGSFSKAVALLEGQPATGPIRFLRALSAHRSADWRFSAGEFESLASAYTPLRDRCLVHAGWGFEALKDWDSAIRVFSQVSPSSRLSVDARMGMSRALRWKRDFKAAQDAIAQYVDRPSPPWGRNVGAEALLQLADIAGARRDSKAEREALLKLWSRHSISKEATKAEARLGDLTALPADVMIARSESLIDAHHNVQGIAILEPLMATLAKPPPECKTHACKDEFDALVCRAHFALGKGYRKQRQHAKALPELALVRKCKDPELRAKALFTLGFSQTIAAQGLAAGTYEALAREFPDSPLADDSLFFAADVHWRRGQRDEAVERLIDIVDKYPDGDFTAEALFKLFWIARTEGRNEEALEFLQEIEGRWARADESAELERARYWRGRLLEAQGQTADALTLYESIANEHPATYYGLVSRERVAELDAERAARLASTVLAAPAAADPFPMYAGVLPGDPQFQSAVELLRMGFGEMVPSEILSIDRSVLSSDSLRLMVMMLSMAQQERSAHGMARLWLRRDLSGPITADRRAFWEIAYPNAFRDLIVEHSQAADELDPDLLQALMREESALDPKALSWAGALGLCQLMPATAHGVAMQLKLKRPTQAALLEPDLNIQLGARYLSDLIIRQKGIKPFAIASYNAGEGAVSRWRRDNGDTDLAAWVEQVPLQETRGYVKRVLRSYNTYKLLYAPGQFAHIVVPPPPPPAKNAKKSG